ncbi:heterokaryon incompatibility protein-domain-containing protein [Podospora appendiculata]|uniref:Heterokaryon incompatibility protein-domain-containing protein n=1 Tax=Podospora appendiculata TaxID=314037 RepID=A0AAE0XGU5_9PEZI|nr:heterokaryon incompatibility protein-domain-containing protein [Podospora appendiculata]
MSDPDCLTVDDFQNGYSAMQAALDEKATNSAFCDHCVQLEIVSRLQAVNSLPLHQRNPNGQMLSKQDHGSVFDLARRKECPSCRLFWALLCDGNASCCGSVCRDLPEAMKDFSSAPRFSDELRRRFHVEVGLVLARNCQLGVVEVELPWRLEPYRRHISYGDLHFVHPVQADHFRVREWIATCEETHACCNEQDSEADDNNINRAAVALALFGHTEMSLRLVDVESRRIVQSLHAVRYVTLSYVWGEAANRTFPVIENPEGEADVNFPPGVMPLSHQPRDLIMGALPQTFEDAMKFTRRLGERYLWIDALCIPQDQPDILADQVSKMDEIYSHGLCTIVSVVSGVESGLPGVSYRETCESTTWIEQLPDGSKLFVPLSSLGRDSSYAWQTRAWTLQEHLLSKRLIFFEPREVLFVCKEMTTKESWRRPHTAEEADKTTRSEAWSEVPLPLPTTRQQGGLQDLFENIVALYSARNLSFPEDRHRAFAGLEGRLSRTYQVRFLHGMPLSPDSDHSLLLSLLWVATLPGPSRHQSPSTTGSETVLWPTWSWLAYPGATTYRPKRSPMPNGQEMEENVLQLPDAQIRLQTDDGSLYSLSQYNADSSLGSPRVPKVSTLALDLEVANLADRLQHTGMRTVWRMCTVLTARGGITFNIGFDLDRLPDSAPRSRAVFPQGRRRFRLLRLDPASQVVVRPSPRRRDIEEGAESLRQTARRTIPPRTRPYPSRIEASSVGLEIQGVGPGQFLDSASKTETALSANLEWTEPDYPDPDVHSGAAEFDTALLIVEVATAGTAARRLGVAYMRMMDFIVAGAEEREVLLG